MSDTARQSGPDSRPGGSSDAKPLSPPEVVQIAFEAAELAAWSHAPLSNVTSWSEQMPGLFGLPVATPPSMEAMRGQILDEDRPEFDAALKRLSTRACRARCTLRIARTDGSLRALVSIMRSVTDEAGQVVRISGVLRDASSVFDRLIREDAHANALKQIVNGSLAFQGLLSRDGILVEVNDTALHASGLTREEVLGQHFAETYWWSHDKAVADRLRDALERAAAGARVRYDEQVRRGDGSLIWIDFLVSPVVEGVGAVSGFVVSGLDVTKRNRKLAEREIIGRELEHRTRNLLAVASALVELTPAETVDELRTALQASLEALGSAQSHLVSTDTAPASLRDVLDKALAHLALARGDLLHLEGPDFQLSAEAAKAMAMIAHELATNALRHGALTRENARISVSWRQYSGGTFAFTWREDGNCPQGEITRRGLGSSIVETLARQMLGGQCARSFPPEGMTWVLLCPLDRIMAETTEGEVASAKATAAQPADDGALGRGCVLIVEDEPLQAMVLAQTLTRARYRVLGPANSLQAAQALLATEHPDLALLDINLGRESSHALARRLDARGVPVVVLSGSSDHGNLKGMPHVLSLPKPVRPKRLLEALETVLPAR